MDINRKLAYTILLQVAKDGAYANIAINKEMMKLTNDELGKVKASFVRQLVYGTLENQFLLDYIIDKFASKGVKSIKTKTLVLLRMAVYQLGVLNLSDYAVINEMVILSKNVLKGQSSFVNGILRQFVRAGKPMEVIESDPIKEISIKYSVHESLVNLLTNQMGIEDATFLFKWWQTAPKLTIRTNVRKISSDNLYRLLCDEGYVCYMTQYSDMIQVEKGQVIESDSYRKGLFSVQDIPSKIIADKVLDGLELDNSRVLDVCAAPGGKTFAIGERLKVNSEIIGCDIYEHKVALMKSACDRLGLENVKVILRDGRTSWPEKETTFDAVLVDGPCSGLGVVRRKPEIKLRALSDQGMELAEISLEILRKSSELVKHGGRLIYSTCTINAIENQQVAMNFLKENDDFSMVEERQITPMKDQLDGFYYAIFNKK